MHGVLTDLATDHKDKLCIVTVDVDRNPVHAGQLGVRGMPTLFLFQDGKFLSQSAGAAPKDVSRRWIEDTIGKA